MTAKSEGPSTVATADVNVLFNLPQPATFASVNATSDDMNNTRAVVAHEGRVIRWILGDSIAPGDEAQLVVLAMSKGAGEIKDEEEVARAILHKVDYSVSTEGSSDASLPVLARSVLFAVAAAALAW